VSGAHIGGGPKEIICVMHLLWGETMYPEIVFQKKGILLLCLDDLYEESQRRCIKLLRFNTCLCELGICLV
jgi:hypothetical protein